MNKHARNRAGLRLIKEIRREYQYIQKAFGVGNVFATKSMLDNIMRKVDELYVTMTNNKRRTD